MENFGIDISMRTRRAGLGGGQGGMEPVAPIRILTAFAGLLALIYGLSAPNPHPPPKPPNLLLVNKAFISQADGENFRPL